MKPCFPFLPLVPFGPRLPRGPGGGGAATQTFPGARQTDLTIIDVTYLLIMCRISCIPTESLIFTGSKLRRARVTLCSVPLQKKINIKHFSNSCFNSSLNQSFISLYNFNLLVSLFHGLGQWGQSKKRAGAESGLVELCRL